MKNKKTILLVDDEPEVLEVVTRLLKNNEYSVVAVKDASEALDALSNNVFDLVITDVKMPGDFSGIDLLKIIKAGFTTPVIVISGFNTLEIALAAMRHGAEDFVPKPINNDYLIKLIRSTLISNAQKQSGFVLGDLPFVIKFEINSAEPPLIHLREHLMNISHSIGLSDVAASSLWLCVKEATENAAVNGNLGDLSKTVTLIINNTPREVEVLVADQGEGFSLEKTADEIKNSETHYMRGLNLIHNLADDVHFNEKGNEIKFVFLK